MTTTVTVDAHCADNIEVEMKIFNGSQMVVTRVFADGERGSESIYGDRSIVVAERRKVDPEPIKSDPTEKKFDEAFNDEIKKD